MMTLAREQAIQVMKSRNLDIQSSELTGTHIIDLVAISRKLEPKEKQLVLTELATHAWLRLRLLERPLYPEFENVLWAYLSVQDNLEEKIIDCLGACKVSMDMEALYNKFLRGMFAASGKTRLDFYRSMLVDAGIEMRMEEAEFGSDAFAFLKRIINSVHRAHLLVFYSTGLVSKLSRERDPAMGSSISEERLEAICRYFEDGIPLEGQFLRYSKDSTVLAHSLEIGRLSRIK